MKKLQLMIVPLLLTALATSAQDQDEDSTFSEFGAYFGTSIDVLENSVGQRNVSLSLSTMIFPDANRVKQYSFYFGGGGSIANTNGVTDTAQTLYGEFGLQTKYVTPYVNVFYTREQAAYREEFDSTASDIDEDELIDCELEPELCEGLGEEDPSELVNLFYGSGAKFGVGVIINSPISDNFSAKISTIIDEDQAIDVRVYYRIPVLGEVKPVFSIGYKRVTGGGDGESSSGQLDGDGFSASIGVSRSL